MKKLSVILIFLFFILFAGCAKKSVDVPISDNSYLNDIAALESQIAELKNNYSAADAESSKRLEELTNLLNSIKDTDATPSDTTDGETQKKGFQYTLKDGCAILTGYVGTEENLVIPASIDGYRVTAIADSAFAEQPIKSVVISNGVESIGWFAFDGCTRLTAITVPSSVQSIGYCALGTSESSATIYCHSASFVLEYAKSYGLTYAII